MTAQELLAQIADFCRQSGLAESTFGRRAVNDGKLANRLRNGGRVTTDTVERIQAFMKANPTLATTRPFLLPRGGNSTAPSTPVASTAVSAMRTITPSSTAAATPKIASGQSHGVVGGVPTTSTPASNDDLQRNFRFFDNRQKYLLF